MALFATVALGSYLFYNMSILNQHWNEADKNRFLAHYEQKYGRYVHLPQPSVTDVKLDVALFPSRSELQAEGTYRLTSDHTLRGGLLFSVEHVTSKTNSNCERKQCQTGYLNQERANGS